MPSASVLRTTTPTRNVVLTERQEQLVERFVKSGRYQNASEVLRDGLRLVEQREAEDAGKLEALRAAAGVGVSALDRGDFKEFRDIEDLQAYLNNLSDKVISSSLSGLGVEVCVRTTASSIAVSGCSYCLDGTNAIGVRVPLAAGAAR